MKVTYDPKTDTLSVAATTKGLLTESDPVPGTSPSPLTPAPRGITLHCLSVHHGGHREHTAAAALKNTVAP